jgi:hypothetical protein
LPKYLHSNDEAIGDTERFAVSAIGQENNIDSIKKESGILQKIRLNVLLSLRNCEQFLTKETPKPENFAELIV